MKRCVERSFCPGEAHEIYIKCLVGFLYKDERRKKKPEKSLNFFDERLTAFYYYGESLVQMIKLLMGFLLFFLGVKDGKNSLLGLSYKVHIAVL